jgi:DNA-binding CsgD family transcriptional regulator
LKEVQEWLRTQYNVEYSRSGLWHLLRTTAKAAPRGWMLVHEEDSAKTKRIRQSYSFTSGIPTHIVRFLNALPTSSDSVGWVSEFREALRAVLGDVDRISVNVNLDCNLSDPESYSPAQTMTQHITPSAGPDRQVAVSSEKATLKPSERILEDLRLQGLPLQAFHKPHSFDYYYGGHAYLGTIFLWREISKPAISDFTVETLIALEPFLIFALSDLVARHQSEKPVDRIFHDALEHMFTEANLTAQEGRVVVLQLMGHSYKEMADMLAVSLDTVKKHFKQIHRKTNTRSQAELFAKYFSPRLMPEQLQEWSQ